MLKVRLETALATVFAVAAVATMIWPTWIESVTRLEPDGGSGTAEWWLVIVLGLLAVVSALLARRHYRALTAATSTSH
jgi:hypothetical protein